MQGLSRNLYRRLELYFSKFMIAALFIEPSSLAVFFEVFVVLKVIVAIYTRFCIF